MSDEQRRARARRNLIAIAALSAAPLVAAYILVHVWRPSALTNYGQLLAPTPVADIDIGTTDGSAFRLRGLKGKWILLMVDSGACDAFCRRKLYQMRQVRLTQGKDMERIERAWLIDDAVDPSVELLSEYRGTRTVRARRGALLSLLPAQASVRDHIYLIDPRGNLMMRYPRDADPSRMKADLRRLLQVSGIG